MKPLMELYYKGLWNSTLWLGRAGAYSNENPYGTICYEFAKAGAYPNEALYGTLLTELGRAGQPILD
jgi:hypothetical protein